jgi:serine/threonine protein kinase
LKVPLIPLNDTTAAERFARERDILAGLTHARIARLYDAGITD